MIENICVTVRGLALSSVIDVLTREIDKALERHKVLYLRDITYLAPDQYFYYLFEPSTVVALRERGLDIIRKQLVIEGDGDEFVIKMVDEGSEESMRLPFVASVYGLTLEPYELKREMRRELSVRLCYTPLFTDETR